MKKFLFGFGLLLLLPFAQAADDLWVDDPTDCPRVYNSVNCGADFVCGVNSDTNFPACASEALMSPPVFNTTANQSFTNLFGGGYLINCHETAPGFDKHCLNDGNFFCNEDSSCTGENRDTICSAGSFGAFSCSACLGNTLDCTGDPMVGNCNVIKNSTNFPVGSNNRYGNTCEASDVICKSGYQDCDGSGNGVGNGCEVRTNVTSYAANSVVNGSCNSVCNSGYVDCDASGAGTGTGCEVKYETTNGVSNPTSYNSAANNAFSQSCQPMCRNGFIDCDGSGSDAGTGCEIQVDVTSFAANSAVNNSCVSDCNNGFLDCDGGGAGVGNGCEVQTNVTSYAANSVVNGSCNSVCNSGYLDCDGGGVGVGNGCEVRANVTSYAPNSVVNGSCTSECNDGWLDCDGTGAGVGNGCEVQNESQCFVNGVEGQVQGCFEGEPMCVTDPKYWMSGVDTIDATTSPLLWGSQFGPGKLIDIDKEGDPEAQFTVENDGRVGIGTDDVAADAALDIQSSNKGVLFPSMTTAERDAIAGGNPSTGLLIFNTETVAFEFFDGTEWRPLTASEAAEFILYPGMYMTQ